MRTLRQQMRWIMLSVTILFVLSIFGYYGFDGTSRRSGGDGDGIQDYAVAEVNGKKIMRSALEENLRRYVERANISNLESADMPKLRRDTLDGIIVQMQLENEAKAQGIQPSEADIDKAVSRISDNFPTKEAFQQYLDQTGTKIADLRKSLSEQLAQQKLIETALAAVKVTSADVQGFYDKTKDLFFRQPAGVKLNFARFKSLDAAKKAQGALAPSSKWDEVMASLSSADLLEKSPYEAPIFVPDTGFVDKLASIASLDIDVPSEPITLSSDDILVVLKREKVDARVVSFDEVSKDVTDLVTRQNQQSVQAEYLQKLRSQAKVAILDASIFPAAEVSKDVAPVTASGDSASTDKK